MKIYPLEIESLIDFAGSGKPICYYSKGHHILSEFVAEVAKEKGEDIDPAKVEYCYMRWEMCGIDSKEEKMRIGQEYPTPGRGKFPVTIVYL